MTDISHIVTLRTFLLEIAHDTVLAATLRLRADLLRNCRRERDADAFDATASILEADVRQARSLAPDDAESFLRDFSSAEALDKVGVNVRRASLRVLSDRPTATTTKKPAKKSTAKARPPR